LVDNQALVDILKQAGYQGVLAVEIDYLHPDYNNDEDAAVAKSVEYLKKLIA
jgi:sugar phosphate isomerase/epimerase